MVRSAKAATNQQLRIVPWATSDISTPWEKKFGDLLISWNRIKISYVNKFELNFSVLSEVVCKVKTFGLSFGGKTEVEPRFYFPAEIFGEKS